MTKFKVGDKVRLLNGGNVYPLIGFENGQTYTVVEYISDTFGGDTRKRIKLACNRGFGYALPCDLELVELKPTKNQRITALEDTVAKQSEEISELKLIIHELRDGRKTMRDVMNEVLSEPSTTNTAEDMIEFEGQQYRKVDRVAQVGDVVIFRRNTSNCVDNNKKYIVAKYFDDIAINARTDNAPDYYLVYSNEYNRTPETVDVYELLKRVWQSVLS